MWEAGFDIGEKETSLWQKQPKGQEKGQPAANRV